MEHTQNEKKHAVIIGAGPAGISAAIYLLRANIPVTVLYRDMGALGKAKSIENFYGLESPVSGPELFERGLAQAKTLGAAIIKDEIVGLIWEDKITAVTKKQKYPGDIVILATGAARVAPKIEGLAKFEGAGVSYCAVCDAFFYRNKNVAVIGNGPYALHEAAELAQNAQNVRIFTMGKPAQFENHNQKISIDTRSVTAILGTDHVTHLRLNDDVTLPIDGVFVALGIAGITDFARKIGAEIKNSTVVVNAYCETSVPGVYACGDCNGGLMQVAKAVCDGAIAARHAVAFLKRTP